MNSSTYTQFINTFRQTWQYQGNGGSRISQGGGALTLDVQTYFLANFPEKLHENDKNGPEGLCSQHVDVIHGNDTHTPFLV